MGALVHCMYKAFYIQKYIRLHQCEKHIKKYSTLCISGTLLKRDNLLLPYHFAINLLT